MREKNLSLAAFLGAATLWGLMPSITYATLDGCTSAGSAVSRICRESAAPLHLQALDEALLNDVLVRARESLKQLQKQNKKWDQPSFLGMHFLSQYALMTKWLGHSSARFDQSRFQTLLVSAQLSSGGWEAVPDLNLSRAQAGDLNATIFNYWYLKSMGWGVGSDELKRARSFIIARGGIEKANLFTKIFLALFRQGTWSIVPEIPHLLFADLSPLNVHQFAQWIGPHLMAIAYLREHAVSKRLGSEFDLRELWADQKKFEEFSRSGLIVPKSASRFSGASWLVDKMVGLQRPRGSWGGYTLATLLTVAALEHFGESVPSRGRELQVPKARGMEFVDSLYCESGDSSYLGVADDGHLWDTALAGNALLDAGADPRSLAGVAQYLVARQVPNGGFPFGDDFEYAPDTDDTAEIILFLRRFPEDSSAARSVQRAERWLSQMQNDDGGWGAFDRNNNGNVVLRAFAKSFEDSAALFDPSSADVTGHVLEALGGLGHRIQNSAVARRGVAYLEAVQNKEPGYWQGAWEGRWAINTIYGTSAALVGMIRAGVSVQAPAVRAGIEYLLRTQNPDGGWGESFESYVNSAKRGLGLSTPSQTAWALLALLEAGELRSVSLVNGTQYLLSQFNAHEGRWVDSYAVGTGHPGVVPMSYPIYPQTWPLSFLGRYRAALELNR